MTAKISLIAAVDEQNGIGANNDLMWHLPDDFKFFKRVTSGHPIIMGRKNFESIGRPLPKRLNIIVTRNKDYAVEGCEVVHSLDDAISLAQKHDQDEIFNIGGGELYTQGLATADRLYLTHVQTTCDQATVFFPDVDLNQWREISRESHQSDEKHKYAFDCVVYERNSKY